MKKLVVLLSLLLTACTPYSDQKIHNNGSRMIEQGVYLKQLVITDGFMNSDTVYLLVDEYGKVIRGNMTTRCYQDGDYSKCTANQNSIPN